jgi:hypothetical protein
MSKLVSGHAVTGDVGRGGGQVSTGAGDGDGGGGGGASACRGVRSPHAPAMSISAATAAIRFIATF